MIENAEAIFEYTRGMSIEQFEADRRTYDAVERCFQRLSEASVRLNPTVLDLMPEVPWQQVRALGNRLRHEYDAIQEERLWEIILQDLPALKAACERALQHLREIQ